jgi:hypothetical protein
MDQTAPVSFITVRTSGTGVILADPPWRFEPWSRETGMDRSADNHYPTRPLGAIMALGVASIATITLLSRSKKSP